MDFDKMTDAQLAAYAITLWINFIQTGDPCLSAEDTEGTGASPKTLTMEQMRMLTRLGEIHTRYSAS